MARNPCRQAIRDRVLRPVRVLKGLGDAGVHDINVARLDESALGQPLQQRNRSCQRREGDSVFGAVHGSASYGRVPDCHHWRHHQPCERSRSMTPRLPDPVDDYHGDWVIGARIIAVFALLSSCGMALAVWAVLS